MTDDVSPFAIVLTTTGSDDEAHRIASALVERRLAACVNVVPRVISHYRWKGHVCRDEERLLVIKTESRLFPELKRVIRELHSYELPEAVMVRIEEGDPDYLSWLAEAVGPENRNGPSEGS